MLSSNVHSCKRPHLWCQCHCRSSRSWCSSWRSLSLAGRSHRLPACMGSRRLPASLGSRGCTFLVGKVLGAQWGTRILGPEIPLPWSVLRQPLSLLGLTAFHGCEVTPLQDLKTSAGTNDKAWLAGPDVEL